jgi:hypothetical protein
MQILRLALSCCRVVLCLQYASNVCGTSVAFFLSGLAYSRGGLRLAAAAGAAFEAVLLQGSAWYVATEDAAVTCSKAVSAVEHQGTAYCRHACGCVVELAVTKQRRVLAPCSCDRSVHAPCLCDVTQYLLVC